MMNQLNIREEARKYFTLHYPLASKKEIDKQVEDWLNKINSGKGLVKFFEERVGSISGKKILDVGFGSGGIVIAFNLAGAEVCGVDIDPELKVIAEKNLIENKAKADLRIYNGTDLPFESDYFDYVVSSSVLEHVSYPEKLLNDVLRVLKPGGKMLLTLPNKYYPYETHTLAYGVSYMPRKMADVYLRFLKRSPLEHDNLHFYSYFDIVKMLNQSKYRYELLYTNLKDSSGVKKFLTLVLKRFNVHYTVLLKQLIFVIQKK